MASKQIYVGVKIGGGFAGGDIVAANNLKGACDEMGVSYNTAKATDWGNNRMYLKSKKDEVWCMHKVQMKMIEGRGKF